MGARAEHGDLRLRPIARVLYSGRMRQRLYTSAAPLLEEGTALNDVLADLKGRALRRGASDPEGIVLTDIKERVDNGISLAHAFDGYAPATDIQLLEAGHRGGRLAQGMRQARRVTRLVASLRRQVTAALIGPVLELAAGIAVLFVVSYYVMPRITRAFDPAEWTGAPATLYAVTEAIKGDGFIVFLAVLIGVLLWMAWSIKHWSGYGRRIADALPPWSMYRIVSGASWLLALGAMVRVGTPLYDAVIITRNTARRGGNRYLADRIEGVRTHLAAGTTFGAALTAAGYRWPSQHMINQLESLSGTSQFDRTLADLSDEWMEDAEARMGFAAKITNYLGILLVGLLFVGFILAVISLAQQVMSQIQMM